jgi:hypothetical protein
VYHHQHEYNSSGGPRHLLSFLPTLLIPGCLVCWLSISQNVDCFFQSKQKLSKDGASVRGQAMGECPCKRAPATQQGFKLDRMLINIIRSFLTSLEQASKYLLDPLTAPEPSQETGPGSHFNRPSSTSKGPAVASTSKTPSVSAYPTPPTSASPTKSSFHPSNPYSSSSSSAHRQAAFGAYPNAGPSRKSIDEPTGNGIGRRRGSSLGERFPGNDASLALKHIPRRDEAENFS